MKHAIFPTVLLVVLVFPIMHAAETVPGVIEQPGTQPGEVGNLESADKCDNCHGGYDTAVEPAYNWRGSMMAQASRDPIFWATLAVAERGFDGAGDLCIRCHSVDGWINGRSVPTDGSALGENDASGVACDLCHKITNPDGSEHLGEQNAPFITNDEGAPPIAYLGSGMYVLWGGSDKLGPFDDAEARHQFMQSQFHRSKDFCGTCHDVSNPAVGELAPNHGAQQPQLVTVDPGADRPEVAFNNFPYQYGVVERTFSEYVAGALDDTPISDYANLPLELQDGAIKDAYEAAMASTSDGNYFDGAPRTFSCQTCHMPPVQGVGCNKRGAPVRQDLPLHDMTGGNYWMPDAILYLDNLDKLRLGGGLSDIAVAALNDGKLRAMDNLRNAASLTVTGDTVRVVNLTGHKLISGYPEGRRMWLNIEWFDGSDNLLREDGAYGWLDVTLDGSPMRVRSLLDLHDSETKIYEAHYAMTRDWAAFLVDNGVHPGEFVLSYDRISGTVDTTLGDLAAAGDGSYGETFHFVLNNHVAKDNRIPPYRMDYDEALIRNALPVPADQYGGAPGGEYDHWDDFQLTSPAGAVYATIELKYQPTSWEYVQFLYLANQNNPNDFLTDEAANLLDAWLNTGMAEPYVMATATWGTPVGCVPTEDPEATCDDEQDNDCDDLVDCDDSDCDADPVCAPPVECNSNGVCEPYLGEDCVSCASDCNGRQGGSPSKRFCCGDGDGQSPVGCEDARCSIEGWSCVDVPTVCGDLSCDAGESSCSCPEDCGSPQATELLCNDGLDDDCDGSVDCDDADCSADPACAQPACNSDLVCDPDEDCLSCADDCRGKQSGNPSNQYCCGNGVQEPPEGDGTICDGNY
jgi:hypothetical protein